MVTSFLFTSLHHTPFHVLVLLLICPLPAPFCLLFLLCFLFASSAQIFHCRALPFSHFDNFSRFALRQLRTSPDSHFDSFALRPIRTSTASHFARFTLRSHKINLPFRFPLGSVPVSPSRYVPHLSFLETLRPAHSQMAEIKISVLRAAASGRGSPISQILHSTLEITGNNLSPADFFALFPSPYFASSFGKVSGQSSHR
jgi:hypothetical protein